MATKTVEQFDLDLLGLWRRAAKQVMMPLASVLQAYIERYFHEGMRPGLRRKGGRIVGRGAKNTTDKLYRNTGRLARSFVPRSRENILRLDGDAIVYGTRVPYAALHEYGGGRMRERSFLRRGLRDAMRERMLEMIIDEMVRNVR